MSLAPKTPAMAKGPRSNEASSETGTQAPPDAPGPRYLPLHRSQAGGAPATRTSTSTNTNTNTTCGGGGVQAEQ